MNTDRSTDERAWLIEIQGERAPQWVERIGTSTWGTYDASKAIRFSRKQDAEALFPAVKMLGPSHWRLIATEHQWITRRCDCAGFCEEKADCIGLPRRMAL